MKAKVKNFLSTKGYYLLLLCCLIAICVGGSILLSRRADNVDRPVVAYSTSTNRIGSTPYGKDDNTPAPTPSATNDSSVSKPITADPNTTATPGTEKIVMMMPIEGTIITNYSADKLIFNKTLQEWRTHNAIDIAGATGTSVRAGYAGKVSDVKTDPRFGLTVIIEHDAQLQTVYCGLSTVNVSAGDDVDKGEQIGILGGEIFCEKDKSTHLHFEVLQGGKFIDPGLVLP